MAQETAEVDHLSYSVFSRRSQSRVDDERVQWCLARLQPKTQLCAAITERLRRGCSVEDSKDIRRQNDRCDDGPSNEHRPLILRRHINGKIVVSLEIRDVHDGPVKEAL